MAEESQAPPSVTDEQKANELFSRLYETHREFVDLNSVHYGGLAEINKQMASFYERLMLLNLGTLALSVNALISLSVRIGSMPHKHVLIWLVVSSWILLLSSTFRR
jgi:hypothetical protein